MKNQIVTPKPYSLAQISRRLDQTLMTLHSWRQGSSKREPLPCEFQKQGKVNRITIWEDELLLWLSIYRPDLHKRWINDDG